MACIDAEGSGDETADARMLEKSELEFDGGSEVGLKNERRLGRSRMYRGSTRMFAESIFSRSTFKCSNRFGIKGKVSSSLSMMAYR